MPRLSDTTKRAIAELSQSDADARDLGERCHAIAGRVIDYDFGIWCSLDPSSLLPTIFVPKVPDSTFHTVLRSFGLGANATNERPGVLSELRKKFERHIDLRMTREYIRRELALDDSLSFWQLPKASGRVRSLQQVTGGTPERSGRAQQAPPGTSICDELRVLLTDAQESWGVLCMARKDRVFSEEEMATASALGPALGSAARHLFLRAALRCTDKLSDPPGLIMLDGTGQIEHITEEATQLLGHRKEDGDWRWLAILDELQQRSNGARIQVQTDRGPVTAHASNFAGQRAVIVERARPAVLADLLVRAYGLSPRERQVVQCLAHGWPTRRIAFELDLADHTVQDHLKAVFDKVGVRSRKEVLSQLFFEHYVPQHELGTTPSPFGWYLPNSSK